MVLRSAKGALTCYNAVIRQQHRIASRVVLRTVSMVYRYTCAMADAIDLFVRVLPVKHTPTTGIPTTRYIWLLTDTTDQQLAKSPTTFETQDRAIEDAHDTYPDLAITGRAGYGS